MNAVAVGRRQRRRAKIEENAAQARRDCVNPPPIGRRNHPVDAVDTRNVRRRRIRRQVAVHGRQGQRIAARGRDGRSAVQRKAERARARRADADLAGRARYRVALEDDGRIRGAPGNRYVGIGPRTDKVVGAGVTGHARGHRGAAVHEAAHKEANRRSERPLLPSGSGPEVPAGRNTDPSSAQQFPSPDAPWRPTWN